jgi:hypothetical protein
LDPQVPIEKYLEKMKRIYISMDRAYKEASAFYFFHYTIAEYLFLLRGFWSLPGGMKREISDRATNMCDPSKRDHYLCPLNLEDRCLLYPYRTMICRLHGLPFGVRRPDGQRDEGPGCSKFEEEIKRKGLPSRRIERTPFYTGLANLEREIRIEISHFGRFKKTIAEMIRDGGEEEDLARISKGLRK